MNRSLILLAVSLLVAIGGCSSAPQQGDLEPLPRELEMERAPLEQTPAMRAPSRSNTAVAAILLDVQSAIQRGQYNIASAQLERALRIEPANPHIWHYLAKVRLNQGRYGQAANLAAKSNALARGDQELRAQNQQIIEMARRSGQ
jgi:Tfp pilus assembly protein PilF